MSGADHEHSSAVADEAIRLVSALAGVNPENRAGADPAGDRTASTDETAGPDATDSAAAGTCTCSTSTVQAVCDVCPICRVAAFLAEVRPETVERVADVLSMVVGSLEAFAAQRRSDLAGSDQDSEQSTDQAAAAPQSTQWQSVQVEDEDGDE